MTHQPAVGPGAQLVVHTLNQLVHLSTKSVVTEAIIHALRRLRMAVGLSQGPDGLQRFDDELLYRFHKHRGLPEEVRLQMTDDPAGKSPHWTAQARISAILTDTVDNCLLLNARGNWTSTDVLLEVLTSYLVAINKTEASLGDLLLDLNNPEAFMAEAPQVWQSLSLH